MKKVAVIGGGLAGLSAAYQLSKNKDLEVTLIESSNRLGGRVKSVKINNQFYDLGGFLILPWYKNFLGYCKEFGIDNKLVRFTNFKEYYWDIETSGFKDLSKVKVSINHYLQYAFVALPKLLARKLNFYNPSYDSFAYKTVSDFIPPNNLVYKYNDMVSQSYTYPPLKNYPMSLYLTFMLKMGNGYFDKCYVLDGNTELIVKKLTENFTKNGGQIILRSPVAKIEDNKIYFKDDVLEMDKIVIATRLNKNLFPEFFENHIDIKYTNNYCVHVQLKEAPKIGSSDKWTFAYIPSLNDTGSNILSLYSLKGVDNNQDSKNLGIILQTTNIKTLTEYQLLELLQKKLAVFLPKNKIEKIIVSEHWTETMPYLNDKIIEKISKSQGKNNKYYAGDYLSGTCMESALFFGKKAAELLIKDL